MSKLQIPKKIRIEDFEATYKELVEKIAYAFNPFADEVYQLLNGGLTSASINRQLTDIIVKTNASSLLIAQPQIKLNIVGKVRGINVISANNQVNPSIYPVSAPFVSFTLNANILTILNVSGLQANSEYRLVLELVT